jgi:SAM-dependent methyltransferase
VADGAAPKSIWDSEENAAKYAAFAAKFPMYRETSRDLVRLAALAPEATVIDLACGTGVTSQEILAVLGADGKVTGVDRSAAMLAIAAASVRDSRVTWVRASAEELDQAVRGPVDAVICNSAIWQTRFASTARAVRAVLAPGGFFVFNIGADFLRSDAGLEADADEFALMSMTREIAADEYGWTPPAEASKRRPLLSEGNVGQLLEAAGFTIQHAAWLTREESSASQQAWLRVPAFTDRQLPGLAYPDRMAALEEAYRRLGPPRAAAARWFAVVAVAI